MPSEPVAYIGDALSLAEAVGSVLRSYRETRGLSQVDAAKILGISAPGLHAIEAGKANPTLDRLERIAEAYDVVLVVGVARRPAEEVADGKA